MTNSKCLLKRGKGWRIGWNAEAQIYKGLVGSDHWAIELTEAEMQDFQRLLAQLAQTMSEMSEQLMAQEKISCEAESDLLWLEVEGYPHSYSLRLILHQNRCCEGNWTSEAVSELVKVSQNLTVF
jgi:hypothetical protein